MTDTTAARRQRVAAALTAEHYRRAREHIVASPAEHSAAMAAVAVAALDGPSDGGPGAARTYYRANDEAGMRAEFMAMQAAIARARECCQQVRDRVGPSGMINASQILGLLSLTWPDGNYEAASDGAEQPPVVLVQPTMADALAAFADCWWCKHPPHGPGECSERNGAEHCECGVGDVPPEQQK